MLKFTIKYIILSLIIIFSMLLAVSFFTLLERKVLAGIQRRHGPVFTGYFGLLQPFADGLKLFLKEISIPAGGYYYVFLLASIFSLILSLLSWSVIPFSSRFVIADLNFGVLFILFISSLSVYATLFSGWSSNSKYGLLGSIRSGAQMISYELPMTLCLLPLALYTSSFNLTNIVIFQQENFWFLFFIPVAYVFFVTALAETNRTPFDLPEAESELVSGYNIEYSSLPFAFFFLAEYNHMLVMSFLFSILFLGGWSNFSTFFITEDTVQSLYSAFLQEWVGDIVTHKYDSIYNFFCFILFYSNETIQTSILTVKALLIVLLFISIRAVAPRYKYIQLIKMCWSVFIPVLFFYLTLVTYVYAGTGIDQGERAFKYDILENSINEINDKFSIDDVLLKDFDSYFPSRYAPIDLENLSWTQSDLFMKVWKDETFMKYIMVKYHYIEVSKYPLDLLFFDIATNYNLAYTYLQEYDSIEYRWLIESKHRWYKALCAQWPSIEPLAKSVSNDRLLEIYFGLDKGTLKTWSSYVQHFGMPYYFEASLDQNEKSVVQCQAASFNSKNKEEALELDFESYFANRYAPIDLNDFSWTQSLLFFETAWSDTRFVKFILVKYHYPEYSPYPLASLFFDITTNHKLAAKYLAEYTDTQYIWVFEPEHRWYEALRKPIGGGQLLPPLAENISDIRVLEVYFGFNKGELQLLDNYVNNYTRRYVDHYAYHRSVDYTKLYLGEIFHRIPKFKCYNDYNKLQDVN